MTKTRHTGTKQATKSEKRRQQILEAAVAQILAEGMTDVGLRRIAARAEMGLSSLQHHYATLDDLLGALYSHLINKERRSLATTQDTDQSDPQATFADRVSFLVNRWTDPERTTCMALLWAEAARNTQVAEELEEFYGELRHEIVNLLRPCHPQLTFGQLDQIARIVLAGTEGQAGPGQVAGEEDSVEANPDLTAQNLVKATHLLAESFGPIAAPSRFV
eukprot:s1_g530.t1